MKLPKFLRANRNAIRIWLVAAGLLVQRWDAALFAAGAGLVLLGAAFRLWSKGYLTQNRALTARGPYAYVRHPFYLGNLILDTGIALVSGRPLLLLGYLPVWLFFHLRQMRKEERKLESVFGATAVHYRGAVPRIIPWRFWRPFRSLEGAPGGFSWSNRNLARHGEAARFLVAITYPLLFFAAWQVRTEGWAALQHSYTLDFLAICAVPSIYAAAKAIQWLQRNRRPLLPAGLATFRSRLALYMLFVAAAVAIHYPEMEADAVVFPSGLAASLLVLAILVVDGRGAVTRLLLEGAGAIVTCYLAEVAWLAAPISAFYAVLAVQTAVAGPPPVRGRAAPSLLRLGFTYAYVGGVLLALLKEYLADGRVILALF